MDRDKFEQLVEKAWDNIPQHFKDKIDNVAITVQDRPTASQMRSVGLTRHSLLLGLYSGVPMGQRSVWQTLRFPDRIILFQDHIERVCRNDSEIEAKVEEVLIHEIAHYFGMSDEEIYALMGR